MDFIKAFIFGGFLCSIGQIILDLTKLTPARLLCLYVTSGVLLSFLGIYQKFVDFASCGATVPLTGFGYSLFEGVKKAIAENGIIGILQGGLSATSAGIATVIFAGIIISIISKSKSK